MSKTKTILTTQTQTQMQTQTKVDLETDLAAGQQGLGQLSPIEERALRMRYGMALSLEAKLSFADEAHPEARAKIEAIERRVWSHLKLDPDAQRKQAIIEELREL